MNINSVDLLMKESKELEKEFLKDAKEYNSLEDKNILVVKHNLINNFYLNDKRINEKDIKRVLITYPNNYQKEYNVKFYIKDNQEITIVEPYIEDNFNGVQCKLLLSDIINNNGICKVLNIVSYTKY